MFGLGGMLERKAFLIGCTLKKLVRLVMAIKNLNLSQKKFLSLKRMVLKLRAFLLDFIIAML
jgi:hypothetical protein